MASEPKDPQRRPRRSLLRRLAFIGALATALVVALYLTRQYTLSPVLRLAVERLAGDALGGEVEIGRIESDLWSWIRLEGVRARGRHGESVLRSLELEECEATFSLIGLLRGHPDWLHHVTGANGRVLIAADDPGGDGSPIDLPAYLPEIEIEALDVEATHGNESLRAPSARVRIEGASAGLWTWSVSSGPVDIGTESVERTLGELTAAGTYSTEELLVRRAQLGETLALDESRIDLRGWDEGRWSWTGSGEALGGRLETSGVADAASLMADLSWREVSLRELLAWLPSSEEISTARGSLSGTLHHISSQDDPDRTTLEIRATGAQLLGVAMEQVDARGEVSGDRIELERLSARAGANRLEARSVAVPVTWSESIVREIQGRFEVVLTDLPALLQQLEVAKETAPAPPHEIRCAGQISGGQLELTTAQLTTDVGGARLLSPIQARLPADGDWRSLDLEAAVAIDIAELQRVAALIGWPSETLGGRLDGELHFAGSLASPRFYCWLTGDELRVQGRPLGRLELRATSDGDELRLEHLTVRDGANRIDGVARLTLSRRWIRELRIDVDIADLTPYLPPELTGGAVRAHIEASGSWEDPTAEIFAEGSLRRANSEGLDFLRLEGRSRSGELWLRRLRAETGGARLDLRGVIDHSRWSQGRLEAEVTTLRWSEGPRTLVNRLPFDLSWSPEGWSVSELELTGPSSSIRGSGQGAGERFELRGELIGFDTDWLGKHRPPDWPSAEGVDLRVEAEGSRFNPELRVRGGIARLSWRDVPPVSLRLDVERSPEHLRLQTLDVREAERPGSEEGWIELTASGELPDFWSRLDDGSWDDAELRLEIEGRAPDLARLVAVARRVTPESVTLPDLTGQAAISASLGGRLKNPTGSVWIFGDALSLAPLPDSSLPGWHSGRVELKLVQDRDRWQIQTAQASVYQGAWTAQRDGSELTRPDFQARLRGALLDTIDLARLIRTGELPSLGLDLHADVAIPDLSFAARSLPDVRRTGGEVEMHARVTGVLNDPQIRGTLRVRHGSMRLESRLPALEALGGVIRFEQNRILIEELEGEIGAGVFSLTGEVQLGGPEPVLDLALVDGRDLLLYRGDGLKARANADLKLTGPWSALALTGRVELTDGRYVKNFDLIRMPRLDILLQQGQAQIIHRDGLRLFSLREAPFRDLSFDIKVSSARPFRVENNVLSAKIRPELRLLGTGELPHLVGNLYVDSAEISLPSTTLEFEQGLIQFQEANPFVPQFALTAQTRMLGYDINVSVSGNYLAPRIAVSSVPPLPQDDLVMLLTTGRPPEEGFTDRNRQKAITGVVVFLGKDLLGQIFGSESTETERSVWEKFEVSTGQDVTRTGQETIEASFLMARDAITRDNAIYIVAERDAYGDYNGGVRLVFRLW